MKSKKKQHENQRPTDLYDVCVPACVNVRFCVRLLGTVSHKQQLTATENQ